MAISLPFELARRIMKLHQPRHSHRTVVELLEVFRPFSQVDRYWRIVSKETSDQYLRVRLSPPEKVGPPTRLTELEKVRYAYVVHFEHFDFDHEDVGAEQAEALAGLTDVEELWITSIVYHKVLSCLTDDARSSKFQPPSLVAAGTNRNVSIAGLQQLHLIDLYASPSTRVQHPVQLDALRHLTLSHAANYIECLILDPKYLPSLSSLSLTLSILNPRYSEADDENWLLDYFRAIAPQITTFCFNQFVDSVTNYQYIGEFLAVFPNLVHFAHFTGGVHSITASTYQRSGIDWEVQHHFPWYLLLCLDHHVKLSTYTTNFEALPAQWFELDTERKLPVPLCWTERTLAKVVHIAELEAGVDAVGAHGEMNGEVNGEVNGQEAALSLDDMRDKMKILFERSNVKWEFLADDKYGGDYVDLWEDVRRGLD